MHIKTINIYFKISLLTFSKVKFISSSKLKSIVPVKVGSSSGSCILSKNGWFNASSIRTLVCGFKSNILSNKSKASLGVVGNNSSRGTLPLEGKDSMYLRAYSFEICFFVSSSGVPLKFIMRLTCSI